MNKKPEVLAIIPARGNSKSIPHKNIAEFAGYPLIAFSIAAATQAKSVTRIVTSTDDDRIAMVAREFGSETPFKRPAELAKDDTQDFPVFQHALEWLADHEKYHPDIVLQLRPTSPIRPVDMVDSAVGILLSNPQADSVRGVVPSGQNPFKMWTIGQNGRLEPLMIVEGVPEPYNAPRQRLPDTYWQTGHIDAIRPAAILEKGSMSGDTIMPLFVDPAYSVDIDTPLDWERAERCVLERLVEMVMPGNQRRLMPKKVRLLVMDFDGVMTDDRVWVNQEGIEMIAASRADGLGLERLRNLTDIQTLVISKEKNPVVAARCKKLSLPLLQGQDDKAQALEEYLAGQGIPGQEAVFIGNDINDLGCFPLVGWAAVPRNASSPVKRQADMILQQAGGFGAVRELCELLIAQFGKN
jgi:N-acylneuraminate cytidylyltransferase